MALLVLPAYKFNISATFAPDLYVTSLEHVNPEQKKGNYKRNFNIYVKQEIIINRSYYDILM